jgi:hypothetical protein
MSGAVIHKGFVTLEVEYRKLKRCYMLREVFNGVRHIVKTGRIAGCCRVTCRPGRSPITTCTSGWPASGGWRAYTPSRSHGF